MGKIYQMATKLPNGHKIYQMALMYLFQMTIELTNFFHPRPSKIKPNLDFWFENIPSGNPAPTSKNASNLLFCVPRPVYTTNVFCTTFQCGHQNYRPSHFWPDDWKCPLHIASCSNPPAGVRWHKLGYVSEGSSISNDYILCLHFGCWQQNLAPIFYSADVDCTIGLNDNVVGTYIKDIDIVIVLVGSHHLC
jgi:hypothetical protein